MRTWNGVLWLRSWIFNFIKFQFKDNMWLVATISEIKALEGLINSYACIGCCSADDSQINSPAHTLLWGSCITHVLLPAPHLPLLKYKELSLCKRFASHYPSSPLVTWTRIRGVNISAGFLAAHGLSCFSNLLPRIDGQFEAGGIEWAAASFFMWECNTFVSCLRLLFWVSLK